MSKCLLVVLGIIIAIANPAYSQNLSNKRSKVIPVTDEPVLLDSFTVIPHSIEFFDASNRIFLDSSYFSLSDNRLLWQKMPAADSVLIYFRVFPFELGRKAYRRDTTRIAPTIDGDYIAFDYSPYETSREIIDFKGLDYAGSFARGISFGNNQDLVLNSSFNLQLSGDLGNEVEILAAISDNNIPLQPEGNTQQLQEFDKIFIQLKKRNSSLTAGDYELPRPSGYFMNYFKKLQGATLKHEERLGERQTLKAGASVAISRGLFSRNTLDVQEGNQGPYKLEGTNGELFIIVLAGTEKVFWDGELLKRGLEYDYVIDYNRGDITFTNKRLVTKDIRVIVEFEYSTQQYLRSLYAANLDCDFGKGNLYFNLFSEQDSKTSGAARDLTADQRGILRMAGNDVENILAPGARPASESANPIRYRKIPNPDTCPASPDSIFVRSTQDDKVLFAVSFTFVGEGQGYYNRLPATAEGTVFEYIPASNDCRRGGAYIPQVKLISPKSRQMFSLGGQFNIDKKTALKAEAAISNRNLNRFSTQGSGGNYGLALKTALDRRWDAGAKWSFKTDFSYEFVQEKFEALNPFRTPEFSRDWNLAGSAQAANRANEHLGTALIVLDNRKNTNLQYSASGFFRDSLFQGIKHSALFKWNFAGWKANLSGSLTQTETDEEKTSFFRPKFNFSKTFKKWNNWTIGVYGERERNSRRPENADTLSQASFRFDVLKVYIESPDTGRLFWSSSFRSRWDYAPVGNNFEEATVAREVNFNGRWQQSRRANLAWNFSYRNLSVSDSSLTLQIPRETYLGRLDQIFNLLKGSIRATTSYEIGAGQEQKIEFIYKQVRSGEEGTHFWQDLNGDSLIQFEEVELPPFPGSANLIRLTQLTNDFIRTNNVQFNQSLRLDPRLIWSSKEGALNFLSRFSVQSTLRILRKVRDLPGVSPWNPFQLDIDDNALVSVSSNINNLLFFNRASAIFDIQFGILDTRNRLALSTGFESRRRTERSLRGRWNFNRKFSIALSFAEGNRFNDSEFFNQRDYSIDFFEISPKLTYQPNTSFRAAMTYKMNFSKNTLPNSGEKNRMNDLNAELTFNQSVNTSVRLGLSFVNAAYEGEPNTPVAFAMLNGLQDGSNFLWNLSLDRRLKNNLQLSFSYDGRKTGTARVIHVGSAQVRAVF